MTLNERTIIKLLFQKFDRVNTQIMSANTKALSKVIDVQGWPVELMNNQGSYIEYEADFIAINRNDYLLEFEVKTSRADFLADFKNKQAKHWALAEGRLHTNRMSFVCPENMIDPSELLDIYGLYYVRPNFGKPVLCEVRKPKLLHKRKVSKDLKIKILRSLMYRHFQAL